MDRVLLPALERGELPVITGFIGRTPEGATTTLGRGGSDYSAALIAAAGHCNELVIWTDVDGVMTTDPRIDRRARVLSQVSYQEVGELAFYGAKVLHPRTVQPVQERNIPLRVRNTFNPMQEGTLITSQSAPGATVIKAVTSVPQVGLLTVSGSGMMGVPGIAGRAFLATARVGANILMISQASSEQSFCFVVLDDRAHAVQDALQERIHGRDRASSDRARGAAGGRRDPDGGRIRHAGHAGHCRAGIHDHGRAGDQRGGYRPGRFGMQHLLCGG